MTDTAGAQAQISGSVMFYSNPEPLNSQTHSGLGLKRTETPLSFLAQTHFVPLTATEFGSAASSYPIIFTPDSSQTLAVMGLRPNENVFVDENGKFDDEHYVPAFVRRYPFVLATNNDQENANMVVCIDRDAAMISEHPDVPFFDGDQPTSFTNDAVKFLQTFEQQRVATDNFVALVKEYDLFTARDVMFTPRSADGSTGEAQKVAEYTGIDEAKLRSLSGDALARLRDSGALGLIYCHLVSLQNWNKVINRAVQRAATEQQNQTRN